MPVSGHAPAGCSATTAGVVPARARSRVTASTSDAASVGLSDERLFPSIWAERNRVIPDMVTKRPVPLSFDEFPWIRDFVDDFAPRKVAKKPAQFGFTEGVLSEAFWSIVVETASVLYCLPTDGAVSDFSASRFDSAIQITPALKRTFSSVSNVQHKRAGTANLWLRGMRSNADLKSIDPRRLKLDEINEMSPASIALAEERISGQHDGSVTMLSTPTAPKFGIDLEFEASDQKRWLVKCPHPRCGAWVYLSWPEVRWADDDPATAHIVCPAPRCGRPWTEIERTMAARAGRWEAQRPDVLTRLGISGYEITRACSLVLPLSEIVKKYLRARHDPTRLEHVMNAFGLTFVVDGMKLTEEVVRATVRDYDQLHAAPEEVETTTMGVDVGGQLHYRISTGRPDPRDPKGNGRSVLRTGAVPSFEDLDELMRAFRVQTCVIDANPERRAAKAFQERWGGPGAGRVWLALYPNDPRDMHRWDEGTDDNERGFVQIHRTEAMDMTLARFRYPGVGDLPAGTLDLPRGLPSDFAAQMCAPVRVYEQGKAGPRAVYRENGADHYAHASLYDEIAALRGGGAPAGGTVDPDGAGRSAGSELWRPGGDDGASVARASAISRLGLGAGSGVGLGRLGRRRGLS